MPELLIVMIVIATVAAIALPMFVRQADDGYDAMAKSDTASLASMMEQCWAGQEDFRRCDTQDELSDGSRGIGLPLGNGQGQVRIVQARETSYELSNRSRSGSIYRLSRNTAGVHDRTCTPPAQGGCRPGGTW